MSETIEQIAPDFTRVEMGQSFPTVKLVEPSGSGFLLLAAEVDRRPMFLPSSRRKRELLEAVKRLVSDLGTDSRVVDASAFEGALAPPGRGKILEDRPGVPIARFDVAVLIETSSPEAANEVTQTDPYRQLDAGLDAAARSSYRLRGRNVRRMGPVDHRRRGVFLINYFYADRTDLNLAAWQYTAGWFMDQTGLDNSTVLLPIETSEERYRIVNHARWDRWRDILPALIFKRSFRTYVLEHFRANGVAAMPVLYRLI